jgi:hypothetical protein
MCATAAQVVKPPVWNTHSRELSSRRSKGRAGVRRRHVQLCEVRQVVPERQRKLCIRRHRAVQMPARHPLRLTASISATRHLQDGELSGKSRRGASRPQASRLQRRAASTRCIRSDMRSSGPVSRSQLEQRRWTPKRTTVAERTAAVASITHPPVVAGAPARAQADGPTRVRERREGEA